MSVMASPLEDKLGFSISPTSPSFSTGRLSCQGGSKRGILDHITFSWTGSRTCNLRLTRQFKWAPVHFLLSFPSRGMMSAVTGNLTGWSNNGRIINLPLFHNCWYADTVLSGRFTRRPHTNQSITLFARIFDETTPIKCLLEARLQISNGLTWWLALNFWPRGIHGAAGDAIRNDSSLRLNPDTRLWEVVSLSKKWISHKILNTEPDTRHYFPCGSHLIQADWESFPRCHCSTNSECC